MAAWPATLPRPLGAGYRLAPVDPTIRTDMEVGAARARRRTAARNDHLQLTWSFTATQMAAFRSWFDDAAEAAGGAAWFNISLDTGDGGLASVEAKFGGIWQADRIKGGLRWTVTATVEVR